MLNKGKIANEFGEVIGAYWYRPSMNAFTLHLYGVNRNGYTEEGIVNWCISYGCQWWEET